MKMQTEEIKRVAANVPTSLAVEDVKPNHKVRAIGKQYLEGKHPREAAFFIYRAG